MRLEQTLVGQPARQAAECQQPFGPGFSRRVIEQLHSLQLRVSDYTDGGIGVCEWQALDGRGECIATVRVRGY
jgi:hypothetical protein